MPQQSMMSAWSEQLAEQFARANDELITVVARCSDAQWQAICPAEDWTVGVTAHHVADDYATLLELIEAIAAGRPVPAWTRELLDQRNADHARQFAQCSREETVALLRRQGALLADTIRALSDEQLALTARLLDREASIAAIAERILPAHIHIHLTSICTALEPIAK